jgi:hypothetical protein
MEDTFQRKLFQTPPSAKRGNPTTSEEEEMTETPEAIRNCRKYSEWVSIKYCRYKFPPYVPNAVLLETPPTPEHPFDLAYRRLHISLEEEKEAELLEGYAAEDDAQEDADLSPFGFISSGKKPTPEKGKKVVTVATTNRMLGLFLNEDRNLSPNEKRAAEKAAKKNGKETKGEVDVLGKELFKKRPHEATENQKILCDGCEEGERCEWYEELGEELKNYGEMLENAEEPNNKIRYHMYRYYSRAKHGPSAVGVRVPLPWCVELEIKREYPGSGKSTYTYFKKAKTSEE